MKPISLMLLLVLGTASMLHAQKNEQHTRIAYQVSLDFQGFRLPFSRTGTYLGNPGFSLGLVYDWNRSQSLQQVFRIGTFLNRFQGRSWYASTAAQFNPLKDRPLTAALSLGVGYLVASSPGKAFRPDVQGKWTTLKSTSGMLMVPLGIQLGLKAAENQHFTWRPTMGYQVPVMIGYNPSVPILPASLIQIGSTFKFK